MPEGPGGHVSAASPGGLRASDPAGGRGGGRKAQNGSTVPCAWPDVLVESIEPHGGVVAWAAIAFEGVVGAKMSGDTLGYIVVARVR